MKFLPKSLNNPKGFTLVELMVVVIIIAILSVIGFTLFTNAQAQGRDGRRRTEINSMAKAIETAKDPATSIYVYTAADFAQDFPNIVPSDPRVATPYCVATDITVPPSPPTAATINATSGCPAGSTATLNPFAAPPFPPPFPPNTTGWVLCASLERSAAPYCVRSLER